MTQASLKVIGDGSKERAKFNINKKQLLLHLKYNE